MCACACAVLRTHTGVAHLRSAFKKARSSGKYKGQTKLQRSSWLEPDNAVIIQKIKVFLLTSFK